MNPESKLSGEQLRLARLSHGLSLEELGEHIGHTRQYIHQLETGSRSPTDITLEALSDVLSVTTSFLEQPFRSTVRPEQCHFRGHANRPVSVTSQILARGTLLDRLIVIIDRHLELPDVSFPDISINSLEEIEQAAEQARVFWGLGTTGPIMSMMRVVENAGAVVTYFGDLSDRVDAFSMDRRRPIIVRSSLKQSLFRQRFDFAHECGHLIMHRGVHTGDRETETQAHRFASAFLFPRSAFLKEFPRGRRIDWGALYQLKIRWKMSVRAIIKRGYDLKIITPAQYKTANIYLAKSGQTKIEKYDNDPNYPVEEPELLSHALNLLNEHVPGGVKRICNEAGLKEPIIEVISGLKIQNFKAVHYSSNIIPFSKQKT